jgi:hypothetical protein
MDKEILRLTKSLVNVGLDETQAFKKAYEVINNTKRDNPTQPNTELSISDYLDNQSELYQIFFCFSMVALGILLVALSG